MKTLSAESSTSAAKTFLIYGEPKSGKTSLALSIAETAPTLLIAAENDGWQDAYQLLSPTAQKNLTVITPETRTDLINIVATVKESKARIVVVDSLTEIMNFLEKTIKAEGGKNVINGITQKISLSAYGDLATLTLDFVRALKSTGCHIVFTAGCDKEKVENESGVQVRYSPLFIGGKTGVNLPYEIRAIGFLQNIDGKRQLWFESSQSWIAGTNYKVLSDQKMIEDPTFAKISSFFPKAKVEPEKVKPQGEIKSTPAQTSQKPVTL